MSGYCLDCGNDLCICDELALENERNLKLTLDALEREVSDNDELKQQLEKLQESNRIMRDALEFVVKNSGSSTDYNKTAREALAKVKDR